MAPKSTYTLILPGDGEGRPPRRLEVGRRAFWVLVSLVVFSLTMAGLGVYGLAVAHRDGDALARLAAENAAYQGRIEAYEAVAADLRRDLKGVKDREASLRRRYDLRTEPVTSPSEAGEGDEPLEGIGGPEGGTSPRAGAPAPDSDEAEGEGGDAGHPIPGILPVEGGWVSSGFGRRVSPFTGAPHLHTGVDIVVPVGTPVMATAAGRVKGIRRDGANGLYIDVDHGGGLVSRYAHLDAWMVERGQRVEAGEVIGRSGQSGNVTGPHLHYELRRGGEAIDPAPFMPPDPAPPTTDGL